jgi:hypothetical protein
MESENRKQPPTRLKALVFLSLGIVLVGLAAFGVYLLVSDNVSPINSESSISTDEQPAVQIAGLAYTIVDTNQDKCYNNTTRITCPDLGRKFDGQDAQYEGNQPSYTDNGDGTVTDNVTGLMWQVASGDKMTYDQATSGAKDFKLAGYDDWRVPTIKELYSLIDFSGSDPNPMASTAAGVTPFIDASVFDFQYGDTSSGSRIIDSQWVTSTSYVSTVMNHTDCFFGVNFADGRIKCYPKHGMNNGYFVRYVRGNVDYGQNDFTDNGDGTVTDGATRLLWQKADSTKGMLWLDALSYCENLALANRDDWRLPNAKELQSLVDYARSPDTTGSATIDSIFKSTSFTNEANQKDWPFYWTSTTHLGFSSASEAVYIAFGRAMGNMPEFGGWIDVHGAGAQRSDPKAGIREDQKNGFGPQGDARRSYNYVRCVADSE